MESLGKRIMVDSAQRWMAVVSHGVVSLARSSNSFEFKTSKNMIYPCPFCGSDKVYVRFYNQPSVCCEVCLCMGPASKRLTKENKDDCEREAVLLWNKRAVITGAT